MNYDTPAKKWAKSNGINNIETLGSLKDFFRGRGAYESEWIEVQEWLYSEGIREATIRIGFKELTLHLRELNADIFIISHKTKVSARNKIDLILPAKIWINEVLKPIIALSEENIFFEQTRMAKINRIAETQITHFVDDLEEIFEHRYFPRKVKKYLLVDQQEDSLTKNAIQVNDLRKILPYV